MSSPPRSRYKPNLLGALGKIQQQQKRELHQWAEDDAPEVEVCIGGMPMIAMAIFARFHQPSGSHNRIIVIDNGSWVDRMNPSYFLNNWGQTENSMHATFIRKIMNKVIKSSTCAPVVASHEYLKWGHVYDFKKQLIKIALEESGIEYISDKVEHIYLQERNGTYKIVLANEDSVEVPMSTHFYNFAQNPNLPLLPGESRDRKVIAADHTELYQVDPEQAPKEFGVIGAGPSMLWVVETFKVSRIYLFINSRDNINFSPRNLKDYFDQQIISGRVKLIYNNGNLQFNSIGKGLIKVEGEDANGNSVNLLLPNIYACTGIKPTPSITHLLDKNKCTQLNRDTYLNYSPEFSHHSTKNLPMGNLQDLFNLGLSITKNIASPCFLPFYQVKGDSNIDCHITHHLKSVKNMFIPDLCVKTAKDFLASEISQLAEHPADIEALISIWNKVLINSSSEYPISSDLTNFVDDFLLKSHRLTNQYCFPEEETAEYLCKI